MRVRFWGTRGSLPVATGGQAIRQKIAQALRTADGRRFENDQQIEQFMDESLDFPTSHGYGGNSSCVQIETEGQYMLCDMGSGLREFGQQVLKEHGPKSPQVYHFFMSHIHWDHILGFSFFPPVYLPGNTINIYGGHSVEDLQEAFERLQSNPCFPVQWQQLGADIVFHCLEQGRWHQINGCRLKVLGQAHHGDSFGYRFEKDDKVLVYSTDAEHKQEDEQETQVVIDFFQEADLVIFDAMYSLADMITVKEDWGHSSNIVGVDLCLQAKVKHYCMFHHEPAYDDLTLYTILQETQRYANLVGEGCHLEVSTAYDSMIIHL